MGLDSQSCSESFHTRCKIMFWQVAWYGIRVITTASGGSGQVLEMQKYIFLFLIYIPSIHGGDKITLSESTSFYSDLNFFTLNFTCPQNISSGYQIGIYGLDRTTSPDGEIDIQDLDGSISEDPSLTGILKFGILKVNITIDCTVGTMISLRFGLFNAQKSGVSSQIKILLTSADGKLLSTMHGPKIQLGSVSAQFTFRRISDSSRVVLAKNTLAVELLPNFPLPAGSTITIQGLTLARDGTGPKPLGGPNAGSFAGSAGIGFGDWSQDSGSLRIYVAGGADWREKQYRAFSFNLTNQAGAQDAASVSIAAAAAFASYLVGFPLDALPGTVLRTVRPADYPVAFDCYVQRLADTHCTTPYGGILLPAGAFPAAAPPLLTVTVVDLAGTAADPCPLPAADICRRQLAGPALRFDPAGAALASNATFYARLGGPSPTAITNAAVRLARLVDPARAAWGARPPGSCDDFAVLNDSAAAAPLACPQFDPSTSSRPALDGLAMGAPSPDDYGYDLARAGLAGPAAKDDYGYLAVTAGFTTGYGDVLGTYSVIKASATTTAAARADGRRRGKHGPRCRGRPAARPAARARSPDGSAPSHGAQDTHVTPTWHPRDTHVIPRMARPR